MIREKGELLLPAVAYGDSAGLPVETKSMAYIAEHFGRIDHLLEASENPFYSGLRLGMWSDDTQLSLAVARGLIDADGFNLEAMVQPHIDEYLRTPDEVRKGVLVKSGWGRSTETSIERLIGGSSPMESGLLGGEGNGVLMKLSPLVYWQVARHTSAEERAEQYDALTTMTHDSDVTRLCTRVHGDALVHLAYHGFDPKTFGDAVNQSIGYHEQSLGVPGVLSKLKELVNRPVEDTSRILEVSDGRGFRAPETLVMAYGAYMLNGGNFQGSVYEAVNLGGDTDSIAAIVAAMSVMGEQKELRLPDDHEKLSQLDMLKSVSAELAHRALA